MGAIVINRTVRMQVPTYFSGYARLSHVLGIINWLLKRRDEPNHQVWNLAVGSSWRTQQHRGHLRRSRRTARSLTWLSERLVANGLVRPLLARLNGSDRLLPRAPLQTQKPLLELVAQHL